MSGVWTSFTMGSCLAVLRRDKKESDATDIFHLICYCYEMLECC